MEKDLKPTTSELVALYCIILIYIYTCIYIYIVILHVRLATHDISWGLSGNRALPCSTRTEVMVDHPVLIIEGVQYRSHFHTDSVIL